MNEKWLNAKKILPVKNGFYEVIFESLFTFERLVSSCYFRHKKWKSTMKVLYWLSVPKEEIRR